MANPFPAIVNLDDIALGSGGFKILGENGGDGAGISVSAAGDVNGDGIADLIVGARYNDRTGGSNAGAAYVVYGTAGGRSGTVDLDAVALGTGGFKIIGQNGGDKAGWSVSAAGDINGDTIADVIVGARGNDSGGTDAGAAYVVYGAVGRIGGSIDLNTVAGGTGGFKIQGETNNDEAGRAVSAAGDVNGDGIGDVVVGTSGLSGPGAAYVVYGKAGGLPGLVDLDHVALGTGGFKISGENNGDQAGYAVSAAGDLNGDGVADLIVGAPENDSAGRSAGAVYVIHGTRDVRTGPVALRAVAAGSGGFKIQGENGDDFAGVSVVAAGDVNGDGIGDVVIGASEIIGGPGPPTVVYGKNGGPSGLVDLDQVALGDGRVQDHWRERQRLCRQLGLRGGGRQRRRASRRDRRRSPQRRR